MVGIDYSLDSTRASTGIKWDVAYGIWAVAEVVGSGEAAVQGGSCEAATDGNLRYKYKRQ